MSILFEIEKSDIGTMIDNTIETARYLMVKASEKIISGLEKAYMVIEYITKLMIVFKMK